MPEARSSPSPAVQGDWFPVSRREHRAQLAGLLRRLGRAPRRVLDIGCGGGRIAIPLAAAGHSVVALDRDASALRACTEHAMRAGIAGRIRPVRADAQRRPGAAVSAGPFDAVVCLGHTFMELHDPLRALELLSALRGAMSASRRNAFLAIDDLCEPLWEEVASGRWQRGISDDGAWQLLWSGAITSSRSAAAATFARGIGPSAAAIADCVCGRWGSCSCSRRPPVGGDPRAAPQIT